MLKEWIYPGDGDKIPARTCRGVLRGGARQGGRLKYRPKTAFSFHSDAEAARPNNPIVLVYNCPNCPYWHLGKDLR